MASPETSVVAGSPASVISQSKRVACAEVRCVPALGASGPAKETAVSCASMATCSDPTGMESTPSVMVPLFPPPLLWKAPLTSLRITFASNEQVPVPGH